MSLANFSYGSEFYVVGGTLRRDAPSYVPRRADDELFRHLASGSLCYVLTSRQMGKSSLMVRTAARLRSEGDSAIVLDLTEVGQNLTVEQWYKGLLGATGEQLALDDDLADVWRLHRDLGPMHRWSRAMREVVLPRASGRVVVFVDEIDAVRSLPFSTDEFFAGIRELFNRRSESPELERLTFCLLGVASPSDLIRDTRTTPFNVGHRIELDDFTADEAAPLARGLGRDVDEGRLLLDRVLYWTGGHPYLTQRLCQAVADDPAVRDPAGVDRLCDDLFLSRRARERDDNLLFVRDRMLRSESDLAELLGLYLRVRAGYRAPDDDANPLIGVLRLSGIARVENGLLRVRNRIYERVFDEAWVRETMPGAEVRRQRRAFTRGFLRAAAVSTVILVIMAALVSNAWHSRRQAEEQQRIAEAARATNQRLLYVAHMNLAYQALERGDFLRVSQLLDDEGASSNRGFEYYYLWRLAHAEQRICYADSFVVDVEFSPDGSRLAMGSKESVTIRDVATGQELKRIENGENGGGFNISFSPDGKTLAVAGADAAMRLYDVETGALLRAVQGDPIGVDAVAASSLTASRPPVLVTGDVQGRIRVYSSETASAAATIETGDGIISGVIVSADGSRVVAANSTGKLTVWDTTTGKRLSTLARTAEFIRHASFSPDNRLLATADGTGVVGLWDAETGLAAGEVRSQPGLVNVVRFSHDGSTIALGTEGTVELRDLRGRVLSSFPGHTDQVLDIDFSPDDRWVASGSVDRSARLWDTRGADRSPTLVTGHTDSVYQATFSADGSLMATAGFDHSVMLWDAAGRLVRRLDGHTEWVRSVDFSPDGRLLASGSDDRTVRLWDVATGRLLTTFVGYGERVFSVDFSPDGRRIASACFDGTVRVWDVESGKSSLVLRTAPPASVECVAFSPDGSLIAAGGENKEVLIWDSTSGSLVGELEGHSDWVNALAFSPDGRWLATAGSFSDTTVVVWDVARRVEAYTLKGFSGAAGFTPRSFMGPTGRANSVRFSPDGLTLAVGTVDRTVKLFDVQTGQELTTLTTPHTSQVYSVAFTPDGSTLATTSEDGTIRLWHAAPREMVTAYLERRAREASTDPKGDFDHRATPTPKPASW